MRVAAPREMKMTIRTRPPSSSRPCASEKGGRRAFLRAGGLHRRRGWQGAALPMIFRGEGSLSPLYPQR
jgi:hypothetical protein